jgi:hypothetical protein
MTIAQRLRRAAAASGVHLAASVAVALCSAALVFGLWYPYPYSELAGGRELFLLVVSVDVVCGPLLTLIIYSPLKPRAELWRDLGIVVLLQVAALGYGLYSVMQARPLFLAFEGDRFRVVSVPDIQADQLHEALPEFRSMGLTRPKTIGVRLAKGTDADFLQSVQLSLAGLPPSFRPARWLPYDAQIQTVISAAKPLKDLRAKHGGARQAIDDALVQTGLAENRLGYLPLAALKSDEWVVLVDLDRAQPRGFLPLSAW